MFEDQNVPPASVPPQPQSTGASAPAPVVPIQPPPLTAPAGAPSPTPLPSSLRRPNPPANPSSGDIVGRMVVMPENFYVPPKRPTVRSRAVVTLSIALLVGGIMWGVGFFISQSIDIPIPFFLPKRKTAPVAPVVPESPVPVPPVSVAPQTVPPATPPADGSTPKTEPGTPVSGATPLLTPSSATSPGTATPSTSPTPPTNASAATPQEPATPTTKVSSSADADLDTLTDEEEKLYLTDPTNPDTDGDGFQDGAEVRGLFAPNVAGGARLAGSGSVQTYTNPTLGYTVLVPTSWLVKAVDASAQEVLFTSGTGEFVSILLQQNPDGLPIRAWYAKQVSDSAAADLKPVETSGKLDAMETPDGLTSYLAVGKSVFVVSYNIGIRTDANFFTTVAMMRNSFTPKK